MPSINLREYIEHKIGMSVAEILADSPERYCVIRTEALRDLVVMNQVAGSDNTIKLSASDLQDPECARLAAQIPHEIV